MSDRAIIAGLWGTFIGGLTFAVGPIAWLSGNGAIAAVQIALTYLMLPGLVVSALAGSLMPGAIINSSVQFAICYFALRFLPHFKKRLALEAKSKSTSAID